MNKTVLDCPPPDPSPRPPKFAVPAKACDCHAHVIGPARQFPFIEDRAYTPPDALLEDYLEVLRVLGLQRAVLVQPSMHGTDNSAMLEAMASLDPLRVPRARAVAVVRTDISESELAHLHERGVRGVRVNLIYGGGGTDFDEVRRLADRVRDLGWHIQFLIDVSALADQVADLDRLGVPLVVDHMGHLPAARGPRTLGFLALLELLRRGNTWVKLSGPYRLSALATPYPDVRPFVDALLDVAPERLVWGSDWPHTVCQTPMPNDGDLLDLLYRWVPDDSLRYQILVENPGSLYDFE